MYLGTTVTSKLYSQRN